MWPPSLVILGRPERSESSVLPRVLQVVSWHGQLINENGVRSSVQGPMFWCGGGYLYSACHQGGFLPTFSNRFFGLLVYKRTPHMWSTGSGVHHSAEMILGRSNVWSSMEHFPQIVFTLVALWPQSGLKLAITGTPFFSYLNVSWKRSWAAERFTSTVDNLSAGLVILEPQFFPHGAARSSADRVSSTRDYLSTGRVIYMSGVFPPLFVRMTPVPAYKAYQISIFNPHDGWNSSTLLGLSTMTSLFSTNLTEGVVGSSLFTFSIASTQYRVFLDDERRMWCSIAFTMCLAQTHASPWIHPMLPTEYQPSPPGTKILPLPTPINK